MKRLPVFVVLILVAAGVFGDVAATVRGLLQKDWFIGFLSGVAATVLGFVLTIVWDLYKMRRDAREREGVMQRAVSEELTENTVALQHDLDLIQNELAVLSEGKSVVQPLMLFKTGFWDVAKINLPATFLGGDRLLKLRNIVSLAEACNEQIRSRENYRIHNGAMSNYASRLSQYDEPLGESMLALKAALEGLGAGVAAVQGSRHRALT